MRNNEIFIKIDMLLLCAGICLLVYQLIFKYLIVKLFKSLATSLSVLLLISLSWNAISSEALAKITPLTYEQRSINLLIFHN